MSIRVYKTTIQIASKRPSGVLVFKTTAQIASKPGAGGDTRRRQVMLGSI